MSRSAAVADDVAMTTAGRAEVTRFGEPGDEKKVPRHRGDSLGLVRSGRAPFRSLLSRARIHAGVGVLLQVPQRPRRLSWCLAGRTRWESFVDAHASRIRVAVGVTPKRSHDGWLGAAKPA